MATLASIKKKIADLEKRADTLLKEELAKTITKVKGLIERHGLTAKDLGFVGASSAKAAESKKAKATKRGAKGRKNSAAKSVGVPVYRDAKSGKTWTGHGKAPNWIAGAKDRSKFLIETAGAASIQAANPAPGRSPVKPKKAGVARTSKKAAASTPVAKKAASKRTAASVAVEAKPAQKSVAKAEKRPSKKAAAKPG